MHCDLAGGGGVISVIMTATVSLPGFIALVSCRLRQLPGLRFQQLVQRLLYAPGHQLSNLSLDCFLIQCYNLIGRGA